MDLSEPVAVLHYSELLENDEKDAEIDTTPRGYGGATANPGEVPPVRFSVEDAIEQIGCGLYTWRVCLIIGYCSIADAMEMMLLTVLSNALRCDWLLSDWQVASITTMVFVGMGSSGPVWGFISDKYGRKVCLTLCVFFIFYFGLLSSFSPNFVWLLILRGLVGFNIGGTPQAFVHQVEFLPSKWRQFTLNVSQLFWALGTLFEIVLAAFILPTLGWKWLLFISAFPTLISAIINMIWLPESARFLTTAGRNEQALEVLKRVAKSNNGALPNGSLQPSPVVARGRIKDLFTKGYVRTSIICGMLWFCCAFTYYGLVLATADILEKHHGCEGADLAKRPESGCGCHPLTHDDYKVMIVSTLGELAGIPINIFLMHFFGRRSCTAICLFLSAAFFISTSFCLPSTALSALLFFARVFTSNLFMLVYLYTAEVYPTIMRSVAVGTGSGIARIGGIITPYVAQVLLAWNLKAAVGVYGSVCIVCGIATFFLPIETKGRAMTNVFTAGH